MVECGGAYEFGKATYVSLVGFPKEGDHQGEHGTCWEPIGTVGPWESARNYDGRSTAFGWAGVAKSIGSGNASERHVSWISWDNIQSSAKSFGFPETMIKFVYISGWALIMFDLISSLASVSGGLAKQECMFNSLSQTYGPTLNDGRKTKNRSFSDSW